MDLKRQDDLVIMDFSGVYQREQFEAEQVLWLDVSDISGTNCYCDGEAKEILFQRIREISVQGVHFIDSGNYHYMSRIWLEKIKKPVTLIVFDNHTDMQLPAFGGILSCGGWIASAIAEIEQIKGVVLIGPDEEAYSQIDEELRDSVKFLSREKLKVMDRREKEQFLREAVKEAENSIYLSVDKDVLNPDAADTSWSQGDMELEELLWMLKIILKCAKDAEKELAGVDICGESESGIQENSRKNVKANKELLNCFKGDF